MAAASGAKNEYDGKLPDLPPGFWSWPLDQQADWIAFKCDRPETVRLFRDAVGVSGETGDRITKNELARAVVLISQEMDR